MGKLKIGDILVEYEEKISARARKVRITVTKGKVILTIPKGLNLTVARKFVEDQSEWIVKQISKFQITEYEKGQEQIRQYQAGEKIPFMGRELVLQTELHNHKETLIKFEAEKIMIYIPEIYPQKEWQQIIKNALELTFRQIAKRVFKEKLDYYSKIMGVEYKDIRVKKQKTKWGSCSKLGNINLNWLIILAPEKIIDYLIIHELAHLKYLNHSEAYWNFVKHYYPSYKEARLWLKKNGHKLSI